MSGKSHPHASWSDRRLVTACLGGGDLAWEALVDKYKNLIYSIVLEYGVARDEASDVFQAIWLDAFNGLDKLRKKSSIKSWLISLTLHKCYHWKQSERRRYLREPGHVDAEELARQLETAPDFVEELERNQSIREAIAELPERCREMVHLLFFSFPPVPYREIAERLGLATGSIGFIRGRCLEKLRRSLTKKGF